MANRPIVAVSGASGFIGTALVPRLKAGGFDVVRLVRRTTVAPDEIAWDVGTPPNLAGVDAVVHLAGEPIDQRWTRKARERIRSSRVIGTRSVARAAAEAGVRTFVVASAIGFYGDRGEETMTETSKPGTGFLADVVKDWEEAASPARDAGVRTVHVRTGIVLGRGGGALPKLVRPLRTGLGGPLGTGRQFWSWIALDDVVGVYLHAIHRTNLQGPVNAVAPEPVRNADLVRTLARVLRRPAAIRVPSFVLRLALGAMAHETVLASQRVLPQRLVTDGFIHRWPDLEATLRNMMSKQT